MSCTSFSKYNEVREEIVKMKRKKIMILIVAVIIIIVIAIGPENI